MTVELALEQIMHERDDLILTTAAQANICCWGSSQRRSYFPALHGNARANASEAT